MVGTLLNDLTRGVGFKAGDQITQSTGPNDPYALTAHKGGTNGVTLTSLNQLVNRPGAAGQSRREGQRYPRSDERLQLRLQLRSGNLRSGD